GQGGRARRPHRRYSPRREEGWKVRPLPFSALTSRRRTAQKRKQEMLRLATGCAAALLLIASIPQALAWEANPEPGYCAQFYQNADCNTMGPEPSNRQAVEESAEPEQVAPAPPPKPAKKKKKTQAVAAPPTAKQQ